VTLRLPLFPLGAVLFPGLVLPLKIFEPRYRDLVRHLINLPADEPREFGVVAIRSGWEVETTGPGGITATGTLSLHEVGCSAELRQVTEHPDGRFDLVTVGRRRFRIRSVDQTSAPYLVGEVDMLPEPAVDQTLAERLAAGVLAQFQRYLALLRQDTPELGEQLPDRPDVLAYLVAATAALSLDDRQQLLAAPDTVQRLRLERSLFNRELTLLRWMRAVPVPLAELAVSTSVN